MTAIVAVTGVYGEVILLPHEKQFYSVFLKNSAAEGNNQNRNASKGQVWVETRRLNKTRKKDRE